MASNTQTHEGGCTCRHVRYRMTSKPLFVHCCHCRWCQRETGAAFALNAMIEADRVELLAGEPEMVLTPSESGKGQKIWRCPSAASRCGATTRAPATPCASCASARSTIPTPCRPTSTSSPCPSSPGSCCREGTPAVHEFYDIKKMWPAESQERRKAMRRG